MSAKSYSDGYDCGFGEATVRADAIEKAKDAEIARLRAELERKDAALREFDWALGQLRHLYVQANLAEGLKNGLLGPQIERLEKVRAALNNLPERNDGK